MSAERPKALKVSVVNCRHLPKKDNFGKCDAFVTVAFEGMSFQTRVIEKNYNPDFNEDFIFDVANVEAVGPLEIVVYDYDNKSSNDTVGEVRLDSHEMSDMLKHNIGWNTTETYVVTRLGADIKGHDGKPTQLEIKYRIEEQMQTAWRKRAPTSKTLIPETPAAKQPTGGAEPQAMTGTVPKLVLEIVVENVRHCPKMDQFGTCDPFVSVKFGAREFKTKVVKNSYNADFGETCQFEVGENLSEPDEELVFELYDWDRVGENELIGRFTFSKSEIAAAMNGQIGHETKGYKEYLDKNGKAVYGKDKISCSSEYILRVANMNPKTLVSSQGPSKTTSSSSLMNLFGRASSSSSTESKKDEKQKSVSFVNPNKDVKALGIKIVSADHLPKMDTLGSCDAFCVVRYGKKEVKTKVVKGTYHPFFNESFQFEIIDLKRPVGDVEITLFDWDLTTQADKIGSARFPASEIAAIMKNLIGFTGEEMVLEVFDENNKPVRGHDKKTSEVTVIASVVELAFEPKKDEKKPEEDVLKDEIARITKDPAKAAKDMKELKEKIAKMEEQMKLQKKVAEAALKAEKKQLEETESKLEVKGAVAEAIKTLLPPNGDPGEYSDLTIEVEDWVYAGEESAILRLAAHCNIIWARCTGLRMHVQKAWNGEVTKGYDLHVVFLRKRIEIPTAVTNENEDKNNKGQKKEQGFDEHDWDPKTCISIPGSVQGTPMRCSCAHGAFAMRQKGFMLGKAGLCYKCGGSLKEGDANSSAGVQKKVKFRINGVKPRVVQKVLDYIYSAECERFDPTEVHDACLVAKGFELKFLLVLLYKQGHFPDFGCAMWEAARVIDADLEQKWLAEILTNVHHHFTEEKFNKDGRMALTPEGFKIILTSHNLHCEEIDVFTSVMSWAQERYKELKHAADEELAKNPKSEFKPTFKLAAGTVLPLIRFPFIAPEDLNLRVSAHPDLLSANPVDKRNVPLVLRAVFHQNGQRGDDWGLGGLGWVPRAGSKHYNGEWEWRYCHAALTDGKWPVQEQYANIDFCWATDDEIKNLGLSKVEIYNLDEDGDGQPTLEEIIHTFSVQIPFSQFEEHDKRAQADQALRGRKEMGVVDTLASKAKATLGNKEAKKRLAKEALWRAVKKISMSAMLFRAMGQEEMKKLRSIVAAGRVRPSAMSGSQKETDPRLHGHAFVIFASKPQARDVALHYNNRKFYRAIPGTAEGEVQWEPLANESPMKIELIA